MEARRRLVTLYQGMHDAIHGKSGQAQSDIVKLRWVKTMRESVLGWVSRFSGDDILVTAFAYRFADHANI
jgi:hypothetical protein